MPHAITATEQQWELQLHLSVFTASGSTPGSYLERQGASLTAVEGATRDEQTKEQSFWPFGPTNESVASFDTSGWFNGFGGANSEETGGSTFKIKKVQSKV